MEGRARIKKNYSPGSLHRWFVELIWGEKSKKEYDSKKYVVILNNFRFFGKWLKVSNVAAPEVIQW